MKSYPSVKRVIDVAAAGFGLVASLPVTLPIAAALFVQNRGDVFYRQKRVGKHAEMFDILKFKTMSDARDDTGAMLPDADRVSPIGKFLRKHSLDEIPQFLNVLKGDMSLIGPRPLHPESLVTPDGHSATWVDKYLEERIKVRPGMMCFHEVRGAESGNWTGRLSSDSLYARTANGWTDTRILARATKVVVQGRDNTNNKDMSDDSLSSFINNISADNDRYETPPETPKPGKQGPV